MIDTTYYLASISILSAIIIAFVIHNLNSNKKEYESKKKILNLQKENMELEKQIVKLHNLDPHSVVIDMYKIKNE